MKAFTSQVSNRFGYDGWALRIRGATSPLFWSVCTTRAEARQLRKDRSDLFLDGAEVVKVKISVEAV